MSFRPITVVVSALLFGAPFVSAQSRVNAPNGIIRRIEFIGLQRISPVTLRAHITSRENEPLDPARVEQDVRALDRLGWFERIRVEAEPLPVQLASATPGQVSLPTGPALRLVFLLEERPFLAKVEFRGSRTLRRERIEELLRGKGIALKLAAPANPTELWQARRAIQTELAELGHPRAQVRLRMIPVPTAAVRAVFEITDGPRVHVAEVSFEGNDAVSEGKLRGQMKSVAPDTLFAGLRGKTIYTPERLAEDMNRVADYYRNHGYPEARVGQPQLQETTERRLRWFPWPRRATRETLHISIPVEEGAFYRLDQVDLAGVTPKTRANLVPALRNLNSQAPYSEEKLRQAQERLEGLARRGKKDDSLPPEVEVLPQLDHAAGLAHVTFRLRGAEPYTVRRIEFRGHHRFTDRYYRRRILLREGDVFDPRTLERGLAQLASTGFIRPVKRENLEVRLDPEEHTADIAIRVEEIGRQRLSLVGGAGGLTNTIGIAYNVFDLLGGEELITTHLEGGPSSLHLLLGLAKEGLFGTRASLGLNLFHNVLRPKLPGASGRERLFTSRSSGVNLAASYPLGGNDTLGLSYELSRTSSEIRLPFLPGVPAEPLRTRKARRSLVASWSHETGRETLDASVGVSGGRLGGDDKLLRTSVEYARIHADPLSHGRNAWAWRGYVAGVSTYDGQPLLLGDRLFGGEQLLRGFRTGELAPYVATSAQGVDGSTLRSTRSGGANLAVAANAEYRVPVEAGKTKAEGVAFFDTGVGWLLPQWLGSSRPQVVDGTNGVLRASTGLELRLTLPVIRQPLRFHYAVNPLRLASAVLSDGTPFRGPDRHAAFGWALGTFF